MATSVGTQRVQGTVVLLGMWRLVVIARRIFDVSAVRSPISRVRCFLGSKRCARLGSQSRHGTKGPYHQPWDEQARHVDDERS